MILGTVTPPGMFHLTSAMNAQSDLFKSADAPVLSLADIVAAATADPAMILIDQDGDPNATNSVAWPMLPIHPKIAVLFLQGRSLMEGFKLGSDILAMIPTRFVEERDLWEGQLRVGITRMDTGRYVQHPSIDPLVLRHACGDRARHSHLDLDLDLDLAGVNSPSLDLAWVNSLGLDLAGVNSPGSTSRCHDRTPPADDGALGVDIRVGDPLYITQLRVERT
jgi:hypothetical protein